MSSNLLYGDYSKNSNDPVNRNYLFLLLAVTLLFLSSFAKGQTYPAGFTQTLVTANISNPTAMAFAPATDGRIFVTQQDGDLRVIKNGSLLTIPALELTVNSDGERGLIGIALDPNFATNQYIYLYYTVPSPLHNRISRFTMVGDIANPASESIVLELDPLSSATNHNGGAMAFGPDGKLYVGVGENANGPNAQDLDTYLGKLLRINSDGSVPAGNPFTSGTAQKQRIWAYGLRNPYTFDFQPGTGTLFIDDVGQSSWEEINNATSPGLNFGWPTAEGVSGNATFTNPVYVYSHGSGDGFGCAITGGTFFNPGSTNYPSTYIGKYFFMDFCENWINYIDPSVVGPFRSAFATGIPGSALSIETGPDGNLYYLSRANGALYKIAYASATAVVEEQPISVSAIYPQPANDVVYIDMNKEHTNSIYSLVDLYGNTTPATFILEGSRLRVNVSLLPSGMYALRIGDPDKTVTKQVSVIR